MFDPENKRFEIRDGVPTKIESVEDLLDWDETSKIGNCDVDAVALSDLYVELDVTKIRYSGGIEFGQMEYGVDTLEIADRAAELCRMK